MNGTKHILGLSHSLGLSISYFRTNDPDSGVNKGEPLYGQSQRDYFTFQFILVTVPFWTTFLRCTYPECCINCCESMYVNQSLSVCLFKMSMTSKEIGTQTTTLVEQRL